MSEPMPTLTTARLVLRPFITADGETVERLAGMREIADTTLTIPHPYPVGGAAPWIAKHAEAWEAGTGLSLALAPHDSPSEIVGAISLAVTRQHARAELGYWVAADRWSRGYATEAGQRMIEYAFDAMTMNKVEARHFTRNPASGRVMQKLGMSLEGVHRQAFLRWGRFEDVAVYAILAADWRRSLGRTSLDDTDR